MNNNDCNFRMDRDIETDETTMHNVGSNSFQFFGVKVTSVVTVDGIPSPSDPIVGKEIVNNVDSPFAKLSDLDVDCQMHSVIYGMEFGIKGESNLLLYGRWTPAVICQSLWKRIACFTDKDDCKMTYSSSGESYSAQSKTTLTNILWNVESSGSNFLSQFKAAFEASGKEELAVRITQSAFHYVGENAGLGQVVGVIGIPSDRDTLGVPGERIMIPTKNAPVGLSYNLCKECIMNDKTTKKQAQVWMGTAPFKVDEKKKVLYVDLSLAFITDIALNIRYIGRLQFGIYYETLNCVELIGFDFGYSTEYYQKSSGMYDFYFKSEELLKDILENPLVVVQVVYGDGGAHEVCPHGAMKASSVETVTIMIQEAPYYIRPKGFYVGRFEQNDEAPIYSNPNVQEVYITKYGQPAGDVTPTVTAILNFEIQKTGKPPVPSLPLYGVTAKLGSYNPITGIAKFEYRRNEEYPMPEMREYGTEICDNTSNLPIDGQVYFFEYGLQGLQKEIDYYDPTETTFLSHSTVEFKRPYTWVKDVGPILTQFARVTPIMSRILNLSDYSDVTKPQNIDIMKKALELDFYDPSYMPTTRDLSPTKRKMILEWLAYPLYEDTCKKPKVITRSKGGNSDISIIIPDRCESQKLPFNEFPHTKDSKLQSFYIPKVGSICPRAKSAAVGGNSRADVPLPERPLFMQTEKDTKGRHLQCSRANIVRQLQTALELEWATIPVYLTSLYSIAEGCNVEIYNLIRSTVMQEMLHFALVGNMLIALGETPNIDHPNIAPSFPGKLPGCVIPSLDVTLEKLSHRHIHDVFMVIELPVETEVGGELHYKNVFTIGAFYNEITECLQYRLDKHEEEIFDKETEKYQVKWSAWGSTSEVGNLIPIVNTASAIEAINTIVTQGEGTGMVSPNDIEDATLAHFFRFEQIYCGKRIKEEDGAYSYSGYPIDFNPDGISNMRPNPTTADVPANTLCYTESRIFHLAYRNFLRQLQKAFKGKPGPEESDSTTSEEDFFVAVQLMEALQLNAKRLMRIEFDSASGTTCGPVWDYEWKGNIPDM